MEEMPFGLEQSIVLGYSDLSSSVSLKGRFSWSMSIDIQDGCIFFVITRQDGRGFMDKHTDERERTVWIVIISLIVS